MVLNLRQENLRTLQSKIELNTTSQHLFIRTATNGLVERFVQTFKNSMRAMKQDNKVLSHKIANFLLNYRNTPHSVTKETPARLFMGRDLRSCLSLVRPSVKDTVMNSQKSRPERSRHFKVGDRVIARDYKGKDHKWIGGQIESSDGPLMYKVKTDLGSTRRRHVDQIKPSKIAEDIAQNTPLIEEPSVETDNINDKPIDGPSTITAVQERRYPERIRKQTKRLITEI